jgi:hypothetical protein
MESSLDFSVVGAYPGGRSWDLLRGRPGERPRADRNIGAVPLPDNDPIGRPGRPAQANLVGADLRAARRNTGRQPAAGEGGSLREGGRSGPT